MSLLPPRLKKIAGIIVLIIFIPLELILLVVAVVTGFTAETNVLSTVSQQLFTVGIFLFPIWWGVRAVKSESKPSLTGDVIDATMVSTLLSSDSMDAAIRITVKLELRQYRSLMLRMAYTKPVFVWLHFIAFFMLLFSWMNYTTSASKFSEWVTVFIVLFVAYLPVAIYRSANTNFKSTNMLHEAVSYEFTHETITISGESFHTSMQWTVLYKVQELKDWFLLYTSNHVAMIISKQAFSSTAELDTFRKMAKIV